MHDEIIYNNYCYPVLKCFLPLKYKTRSSELLYRRVLYVLCSGNAVGLKKVTISQYFRFTTEDFEIELTISNTT